MVRVRCVKLLAEGKMASHVTSECGGLASLGACLGRTGQGCCEREDQEGAQRKLEV